MIKGKQLVSIPYDIRNRVSFVEGVTDEPLILCADVCEILELNIEFEFNPNFADHILYEAKDGDESHVVSYRLLTLNGAISLCKKRKDIDFAVWLTRKHEALKHGTIESE